MEKKLENYRRSYEKHELRRKDLEENPLLQFQKWLLEAEEDPGIEEVNAMTLASIGLDGFPKSRVVLLKNYNEEGFVFFTNYDGEKGKAILKNPRVCLSFFWPSLERQIIIKGTAQKSLPEISDAYFRSRPFGSRLSAVVSKQSTSVPNRGFLEEKLKMLEEEYREKPLERPEFWGGFQVKPVSIEFWQGRKNRLHDRFLYRLQNEAWKIERLAP